MMNGEGIQNSENDFVSYSKENSEVICNPRSEHFDQLFDEVRFKDWERFNFVKGELDGILYDEFREEKPVLKPVGSSATGTMRQGHEDIDYAIAFTREVDMEGFIKKISDTELNITEINQHKKYNYFKASGKFKGIDFVLVPTVNPEGVIKTYEQDAFYHSDFINKHKPENHARTVILLKEFFEQIWVYKQVKGISCEMMSLYFKDFDRCIEYLASHDKLRINFSSNQEEYTDDPLVIDYPFLGGRSFTNKITPEIYSHIQSSARALMEDYKLLRLPDEER